jgi:hypothetical protein
MGRTHRRTGADTPTRAPADRAVASNRRDGRSDRFIRASQPEAGPEHDLLAGTRALGHPPSRRHAGAVGAGRRALPWHGHRRRRADRQHDRILVAREPSGPTYRLARQRVLDHARRRGRLPARTDPRELCWHDARRTRRAARPMDSRGVSLAANGARAHRDAADAARPRPALQ